MDFKRKKKEKKRRKDRVVTGIEPGVTPTSSPACYHYTTNLSLKYFHQDAVYDHWDAALIRRGAKFKHRGANCICLYKLSVNLKTSHMSDCTFVFINQYCNLFESPVYYY